MLGGSGIEAFSVMGAADRVAASVVNVTGQPFVKALRVEVEQKSQSSWDAQLQALSKSEVRSGDVLLASFWFRTESVPVESGEEINLAFVAKRGPGPRICAARQRSLRGPRVTTICDRLARGAL